MVAPVTVVVKVPDHGVVCGGVEVLQVFEQGRSEYEEAEVLL